MGRGSNAIEYGQSVHVDASPASDVVEYKTLNTKPVSPLT